MSQAVQTALDQEHFVEELCAVQRRVVNAALLAAAAAGLLGLPAVIGRAMPAGWQPAMVAQLALCLSVALLAVLHKQVSSSVRGGILISVLFIFGAWLTLTGWLGTGAGGLCFIAVSMLAVILLGTRWGLAVALVGTLVLAFAAAGNIAGWLPTSADYRQSGTSVGAWLLLVASYTAWACLLVYCLGAVLQAFSRALGTLTGRVQLLERDNERLELEVAERRRAEEQARQLNANLEERFRLRTEHIRVLSQAIEQSPVSIVITDPAADIEFTNPAFTRVCGYSREEALGRNPRILHSGKTPRKVYEDLWATLGDRHEWHGEFINRKKNGDEYIEEAWIAPLLNERGQLQKYVGVKLDITKRRELEEQLRQLSRVDPLTELANRRVFDETLEGELNRASRTGKPLSLIMLDIDFFKNYNDAYGHQAGDRCLQQVATVLGQQARRAGDLVARYGGEEFAVVLSATDAVAARAVAEAIRQGVAALAIPHEQSSIEEFVTISSGVVTTANGQRLAPADVIKQADAALYRAKEGGRNRVESVP